MKFSLQIWTALLAAALPLAAQGPGGAAEKKVSDATVLVRSTLRREIPHGTGFLAAVQGDVGIVFTTGICIGGDSNALVTFHAGTPEEKTVEGEVIAVQGDRGPATVRVRNLASPPVPLALSESLPKAGESIFSPGFPIAPVKDAPLSSLRWVKLEVLQAQKHQLAGYIWRCSLKGALEPGDNGAPAVDRAGRVFGYVDGASAGGGGGYLAVASELQEWLLGGWTEISTRTVSAGESNAKVEVSVKIVSPTDIVPAVTFSWIRSDRLDRNKTVYPGADREWPRLHPSMKDALLKIADGVGSATIEVERAKGETETAISIQLKFSDGKGKSHVPQGTGARIVFEKDGTSRAENPIRIRVPSPRPTPPPVLLVTPLETSEEFRETSRLARKSVLVDMLVAPGATQIVVLDLSAGSLLRLDPETLAVIEEIPAPLGVSAMSLTPNRKCLWVVGESPAFDDQGRIIAQGWALPLAWPGLAAGKKIDLPFPPREVVAGDSGLLACSTSGGKLSFFDTIEKTHSPAESAGTSPRLHASQNAIYILANGGISGHPFGPVKPGTDPVWKCIPNSTKVGGEISLSPDGLWVVATTGDACMVQAHRDRDGKKTFKFDPCLAFATAPGSSTFFASTGDGTLREYEFGDFVLKREHRVGSVLCSMSVDPVRKRLYGVALTMPPDPWGKFRRTGAGDVVSISLEVK